MFENLFQVNENSTKIDEVKVVVFQNDLNLLIYSITIVFEKIFIVSEVVLKVFNNFVFES